MVLGCFRHKTVNIADFSDDASGVYRANPFDRGQCVGNNLHMFFNCFVKEL